MIDGNDVLIVVGRGAAGRGAGPGRPGTDPARGQDLPALRAQPHRPGQLPAAREVEQWLSRDPLDLARARLRALGVLDESVAAADERAAATVAEAVAAAKAAPGSRSG